MFFVFFFNDTATTEIYTLSLHDALPIYGRTAMIRFETSHGEFLVELFPKEAPVTVENFLRYVDDGHFDGTIFHRDRKSTRLNSSHSQISYAVFCLKKKKLNTHYPSLPTL